MIKDVHINNPKRSLLRGSNSDTDSAHSRRAPRLRGVLEAVAAGKVREIAFSPKLAIASFIVPYLECEVFVDGNVPKVFRYECNRNLFMGQERVVNLKSETKKAQLYPPASYFCSFRIRKKTGIANSASRN